MKKVALVLTLLIALFLGFILIRWLAHVLYPDLNLKIESVTSAELTRGQQTSS